MKLKRLNLILMAGVLAVAPYCAKATEIEKKEAKGQQAQEHELQELLKPQKILPGELILYCDLYEGYDNNVYLNSSRKGDLYSEAALELGYRKPFANGLDATLSYYLSAINYNEMTDFSFYDNNLKLEVDRDIFDSLFKLGVSNNVEYIYYPKDEDSIFYALNSEVFIQHNFTNDIYHRLIYSFMAREYDSRKAEDGSGVDKSAERRDLRNGVAHELRAVL
ncbi:MAG: hypothetical protein ABH885_02750, partial [Candidatus Omnitrophota bacterium]